MLLLLAAFSCGRKTEKAEPDHRTVIGIDLSQKDTSEVTALVNQYFECLKARDIDKALSMIYFLKGDSITEVPDYISKKQRMALQMFPAVNYEIDHFTFLTEKDCEVKYNAILFEKKEGDNTPNIMSFMLKPIRKDGKWYLTIADRDDNNTTHSKISN